MYMNLEKKMCKELEALEEKYRTGAEMSEGDLRRIDLLVHSLKSMATYRAMKNAEEYENNQSYMGNSYTNNASYANNYRGRENPYNSGHYPYQPMYPEERRW